MKKIPIQLKIILISALSLIMVLFYACSDGYDRIGVQNITIDKDELIVMVGDAEQLLATILPNNASNKKIEWMSSDTSIAEVNVKGEVIGVKEGETTVTAITDDGGKRVTCKVLITKKVYGVTAVKLNPVELTLVEGDAETLVAEILPEEALNKNTIWTIDNESVAQVNENGVVTAISEGEAIVTVTTEDGGRTAECKITVHRKGAVLGLKLDPTSLTLEPDDTQTINVTILPEDAINKNVVWTSDDESVAKVDGNGLVTAINPGIAIITATSEDGGKTATSTVIVKAVFKDDFNRANTGLIDVSASPNPIGSDWKIIAGYAQLLDQKLTMKTEHTGLRQGIMLNNAVGSKTKNGGSFKLSTDLNIDAAVNSGWVGLVINAKDAKEFYVLRTRPYAEGVASAVQFLATSDGGANWVAISSKTTDNLLPGNYHIELASNTPGEFNLHITKENGETYYEVTLFDSQARFKEGYIGYYVSGGSNVFYTFDNFSLEIE